MSRWAMRALLAAVCVVVLTGLAARAGAQSADPVAPRDQSSGSLVGPTISPSISTVESGQRIDITFDGWDARLVTLMVCGNAARRGSSDCDQVNSQGVALRGVGLSGNLASMVINAPQLDCPCALRAIGIDTHETALAPIEIVGHPSGPIVEPPGGTLTDVSMSLRRAKASLLDGLRTSFGGPVAYDVTIEVKNLTLDRLDNVVVYGSTGHVADHNVAAFTLAPGPIDAGRTWSGTTRVVVPAPTLGGFQWGVTATGAGPVVTAEASTRTVPWLLLVAVALLVGDIVFIVVRYVQRRRDRNLEEVVDDELDGVDDSTAVRPSNDDRYVLV